MLRLVGLGGLYSDALISDAERLVQAYGTQKESIAIVTPVTDDAEERHPGSRRESCPPLFPPAILLSTHLKEPTVLASLVTDTTVSPMIREPEAIDVLP